MADWTSSMQHSFEYYEVDKTSWMDKRKLSKILSCSITRDISHETLGNANFESHELLNGETYVRVYFTPIQNGFKESYPLGTFIVQTSGKKWNGRVNSYSLDAYTPLLELKDNKPPLGYSVRKGAKIMDTVTNLLMDYCSIPFVPVEGDSTTLEYDFSASGTDTWLSYISDLMAKAKYSFNIDELGVIYFEKKQDIASLQPRWTYTDDNSSIIYPDISFDDDIYGVPNILEVVYTNDEQNMSSVVENDDPDSPISTANRHIVYEREENPDFGGTPTQQQLDAYAKQQLENLSTVESSISYSHGYTPVRIYDCIRLHHKRADMLNIKARVVSQKLNCTTGLKVDETAVFTNRLWEVK